MPLAVLAGVLCWQLVPLGFPLKPVSGSLFRAGLSSAYFSAAVTLITLMALLRVRPVLQSIDIYLKGMTNMTLVAVTLLLAWALSDIGRSLGADVFISGVTEAALPVWLLPAVIFVLSAMLSFATGSSWGTFAIMFPLVIPTASLVGAPLYACMGAVLSGGLFGDHSSPISETTILSSTGAGCAQIEHFRTQLPYALFNGMISLFGFLLAGMHGEYWILLMLIALQTILLMSLQRLIKARSTSDVIEPDRRGRFTQQKQHTATRPSIRRADSLPRNMGVNLHCALCQNVCLLLYRRGNQPSAVTGDLLTARARGSSASEICSASFADEGTPSDAEEPVER